LSETRKIQKIGNTLYISIPKTWTDQLNLKHGEKITLVTQDGSISLYPKAGVARPREITLSLDRKSSRQSLKRGIIAAYLDGFDTIELKTDTAFNDDQQEAVRDTINSLFGLEVIEVTSNTIVIECLLKQKMPIDKTLNRIHKVIMSMFTETVYALEMQNFDLIKGLRQRIQDCKRLSLVTNRLLRSTILFPQPSQADDISLIDCVDYLQILHLTSEITANLKKIAANIVPLINHTLPKSVMTLMVDSSGNIKKLYNDSIQALLTKDIPLANKILDTSFDLTNLWNLSLKTNEKSEISSLSLATIRLFIDSLEQIQKRAHEIANIAIDRTEAATARTTTRNPAPKTNPPIFTKKSKHNNH
jgi:AbrB family looped-hinge helix DNA binding protein